MTARQAGARYAQPPSLWWGVLALLAMPVSLAGMLYLGAWYWQLTMPAEVAVPKVVSLDEEAAIAVLQQQRLRPRVTMRQYDEHLASGKVLEVVPPANRIVKQGRPVALVVSKGSRWTTMPDLGEMSLERARNLVLRAELRLAKVVEVFSEKVPAGYTVAQRPAPGERLERASAVTATVSKGLKPPPEPEAGGETKYAEVDITVPPGDFRREVRVSVEDDNGLRDVFREWKDPGSHFTITVEGTGQVTVRVFLDAEQVQEKTI